jgi:protein-S-isoprenylcysteine O-methyltransferase Ste14
LMPRDKRRVAMQIERMKWIDIPPVWLVGALGLCWLIGHFDPWHLSFGWPVVNLLAGLLIGAGVVLMVLAIIELRKWKTTVIPHQEAGHLVTSGIFKRSRNPIYLGDTLMLAGFILYWDAPLALPLVPIFLWVIEKRFVIPEENRLRTKFRQAFHTYCQNTRRWI